MIQEEKSLQDLVNQIDGESFEENNSKTNDILRQEDFKINMNSQNMFNDEEIAKYIRKENANLPYDVVEKAGNLLIEMAMKATEVENNNIAKQKEGIEEEEIEEI